MLPRMPEGKWRRWYSAAEDHHVSTWKLCSSCKKPIAHGSVYYLCSVSTCNRKRMPLCFCSVDCWDAHVPGARHRDAWAEENVAPPES